MRGLSERRACTLLSVARSSLNYESVQAVKDAEAVSNMVILSAQYPRYGYRRIRIFMERQGHHWDRLKIQNTHYRRTAATIQLRQQFSLASFEEGSVSGKLPL